MWLAESTVWPYRYTRGGSALIVSMPHVGTFVPHRVGAALADRAAGRPDTDWHLARLYDFVGELDATVVMATHSRYVIDLNRPPDGANLYPGRDTPRLCPVDTFHGEPLYRAGREPSASEVARRLDAIWHPYHRRLAREVARIRSEHGAVLLWDAHSIVSRAPRLFEGTLPDFNLGSADGRSCDPALAERLGVVLRRHPHTSVLDGRFKGGYITRHYGDPGNNVHAIQLEMSQALYMEESAPWTFRPERAARVRPILRELLQAGLASVNRTGPRALSGKEPC